MNNKIVKEATDNESLWHKIKIHKAFKEAADSAAELSDVSLWTLSKYTKDDDGGMFTPFKLKSIKNGIVTFTDAGIDTHDYDLEAFVSDCKNTK